MCWRQAANTFRSSSARSSSVCDFLQGSLLLSPLHSRLLRRQVSGYFCCFCRLRLQKQQKYPFCERRRREEGGEPILVSTTFLPYRLFPGLESENLTDTSLYLILREKYGV